MCNRPFREQSMCLLWIVAGWSSDLHSHTQIQIVKNRHPWESVSQWVPKTCNLWISVVHTCFRRRRRQHPSRIPRFPTIPIFRGVSSPDQRFVNISPIVFAMDLPIRLWFLPWKLALKAHFPMILPWKWAFTAHFPMISPMISRQAPWISPVQAHAPGSKDIVVASTDHAAWDDECFSIEVWWCPLSPH